MATRSRVGMKLPDGQILSIYVHWDGYPEHHGPLLLNHYNQHDAVKKLMSLGDLSSLGERLGERTDFDRPDNGQCVAYGRDRGEVETDAQVHDNLTSFLDAGRECGAEWFYLFDGKKWKCSSGGRWKELKNATPEVV